LLRLKRDGLLCPGGDHITQAKVLRIGSAATGGGDGNNYNTSSGSGGSTTNNNTSGVDEAGWEAQVEACLRSSPALASLQVLLDSHMFVLLLICKAPFFFNFSLVL